MALPPLDSLLGPPALRRPSPSLDILTLKTTTYEQSRQSSHLPSNPFLEFFFKAIRFAADHTRKKTSSKYWYPGEKQRNLIDYEKEAWKFDPLTTLKLIFALRMVESLNKDGFYRALLWVHKNHPLTLSLNVLALGRLGRFKDLLGFLYFILEDCIKEAETKSKKNTMQYGYGYGYETMKNRTHYSYDYYEDDESDNSSYEEETGIEEVNREEITGTDPHIARLKIAVKRYQSDCRYRNLHDGISEMFAHFLTSDLSFLESGEIEKISFASKFCHSVNSSYDRATLLCENIAKRIFPRHDYEEYRDVEEAHYAYRVRDRLRRQVLIPLRKVLEPSTEIMNAPAEPKSCS